MKYLEKNLPKVSVIIPSYQNEKELPRAIKSVQNQDFKDLEIIIINNASTDNTSQVCDYLAKNDNRIKWVELFKNVGPAGARNEGVNISLGKYIAFIDADDEWLDGKLNTQVELLEQYPDISLVFCDGFLVNELTNEKIFISKLNKLMDRKLIFKATDYSSSVYLIEGNVRLELYRGNFINLSTVVLRKEDFNLLNGFDQNCFGMEDHDLWVRLSEKSKFIYWYEKKINYNWRPTSLSRLNEDRIRKLIDYYSIRYSSSNYQDLKQISQQHLYFYYKQLILYFSKKWKPLQAFNAFRHSLIIQFYPSLLFYSLLSVFGEIPILTKLKIINPIITFLKLKRIET
jgi:glycosyltransferase involved in cell wall biosynthesis